MGRITSILIAGGALLLPLRLPAAGQAVLHMEIGDPARKGREVSLVLDGITDTGSGDIVTPDEMAQRLADTGLLFIGENHTNMDFHEVQFRTIKALHEAGREVLIGLEMFPYTQQASLDDWNNGLLTEQGFVELAGWYKYWGYHWNYYRHIFRYAREHGIRFYAVNTPHNVVTAVRKKGFENLTEEEAAHLPTRVVTGNAEHARMYRAFFDKDDALHMTDSMMEGMLRAQATWDATMGWNALQALREHGGPGAIMVVLIGAGHVTFGLGAELQTAPHYEGKISSLIPVPVVDDEGLPVETVRASYANFIWGVPEQAEPMYPVTGLSFMGSMGSEPMQVIAIGDGSVGQRSGFLKGDVLLALDGRSITSRTDMKKIMAGYRWGDVAVARVRREGRELELTVPFRRAAATH